MVFSGTPNLLVASLFVIPFSMCDKMSHFTFKSFRIHLTFDKNFCFDDTENKKTVFFFSFTAAIFVLIQIQIYSGIQK